MAEILRFFEQHQFLAWCALWLLWGVIFLLYYTTFILFRFTNRLLRTLKVLCRGWPPEHIDADGDWKPGAVEVTQPEPDQSMGIKDDS